MANKGFLIMGQHGFPAHPDDRFPGNGRCGCHDATSAERRNGQRIESSAPPALGRDEPQAGIPFVVQAGSALFMVALETTFWTLAELRFDSASCTFAEARRARFEWPREAFGAMLSRVAVSGEIDSGLINRITTDFSGWLAQQFVAPPVE